MTKLVFEKYEILRRLAIGGMGEVFLARQRGIGGFDRLVILKSLLPDLATRPDFVDQFLDEARVAATLNHTNIVQIYEVGKWEGVYFIAMEYIRGGNLAELRKRAKAAAEPLPLSVAMRVIHDAALGLDFAHHAVDVEGRPLGVVHRDISPHNIMVAEDGSTKVVDFGIAVAANRATRTATGVLKGKYAYMSPEQVDGFPLDGRSDLFALGVVAWEMVTGKRLFKGTTDIETLQQVKSKPIPPVRELVPQLPPKLDEVVTRMLVRDRDARYQRCSEVAADLRKWLDTLNEGGTRVDVAAFVKRIGAGQAVDMTTPSPTGENFLISLNPMPDAEVAPPTRPESGTAPGSATRALAAPPALPAELDVEVDVDVDADEPRHRRRKAIALLSAAGVVVVVLAMFLMGRGAPSDANAGSTNEVERTGTEGGSTAPDAVVDSAGGETAVDSDAPEPAPAAPVIVRSTPTGATVTWGEQDVGATPARVDELEAGVTHELTVAADGYRAATLEVTPVAGEVTELAVVLERERRRRPPRGAKVEPAGTVVSAPAGPGFVTVNTKPWTKVLLDGKLLGTTPLFKTSLPAGTHTLVLVNEDAGIREKRQVQVVAGKVEKVDLDLRR